jgi:hypothetical protein
LRGIRVRGACGLFVDLGHIYLSKGIQIYEWGDSGDRKEIGRIRKRGRERFGCHTDVLQRLTRHGFRELAKAADCSLLGVVGKSLLKKSPDNDEFLVVFIATGNGRPKGIVSGESGRVYVGEYALNPKRKLIRIWGADGKLERWENVFVFDAGSVRHIHNLVWDQYRKGIWILTGDLDGECGLFFTRDGFRTVDEVARGGQEYRACDVFCAPDALYYGTDSELLDNWLVRFEPETGKTSKLQALPGSTLYMNKMAGRYFLSTAVEPSKVNKYRFATLWQSIDLSTWTQVIEFEKDFWPGEYFGFGRIVLPRVEGDCPYVVFTPMAVKKYHMTTFICTPENIGP